MDKEQRLAYLYSQIACMNAELAGMQASDAHQVAVGGSKLYTEESYHALPTKYGLHHNAVITLLLENG